MGGCQAFGSCLVGLGAGTGEPDPAISLSALLPAVSIPAVHRGATRANGMGPPFISNLPEDGACSGCTGKYQCGAHTPACMGSQPSIVGLGTTPQMPSVSLFLSVVVTTAPSLETNGGTTLGRSSPSNFGSNPSPAALSYRRSFSLLLDGSFMPLPWQRCTEGVYLLIFT